MNFLHRIKIFIRQRRYNKQYKKGAWDYLKNNEEAPRYDTILEFIKNYAPQNPAILDLGSGEGIVNERILEYPYSKFTGVDFSVDSIKKANAKNLKNSKFVVGDIHTYKPDGVYDVIIFNEVFYYIQMPERHNVLNRLLEKLSPNGIFIVSIYREGHSCWEFFKENNRLTELDFKSVTTDEELRYWKIGAYRKNA